MNDKDWSLDKIPNWNVIVVKMPITNEKVRYYSENDIKKLFNLILDDIDSGISIPYDKKIGDEYIKLFRIFKTIIRKRFGYE